MTGINETMANISGYLSQIADLQRQCADWRGCATTPATEKEKQISGLQAQIQTLQHQIEKVEIETVKPVAPASEAYDIAGKNSQAQTITIADGINRPDTDPFAISGSVVNLKI